MHSILLFKYPPNITLVPYSVESTPPVFHVVTLENPGGISLPMNALNSSKKGNSLWDHTDTGLRVYSGEGRSSYPKGTWNREARWRGVGGHPSLLWQETDGIWVKYKNTPLQESVKERAGACKRHLFFWTVSSEGKDGGVHG